MSDELEPIDEAVRRLTAAYEAAGLPPVRQAADVEAILAEIGAEIAPFHLPAELVRFWRLVDPGSITVAPYPHPTDAAFALESWTSHRDDSPGMVPRLLFPVAYESHGFLFVELEDGLGSGGAVLQWAYAGSRFVVRFPTLSAYLHLLATMIELGEFTRHQTGTHAFIEFDPERRWQDALDARLSAAQPLANFGHFREVDDDVRAWPEHWLLGDGLIPEMRTPRGATTTVAELLRQAAAGTAATGTVRARATSLAGTSAGWRAAIDDGTGLLDVWCPAQVCVYGPVIGAQFEFDITMQSAPDPPPDWNQQQQDIERHAAAHDLHGAQTAAMDLYSKTFPTPAAAEATAVRPVA